MLEKQLSQHFANIFHEYQIWTPNNRTAGWPDRGVQVAGRLIWFELKIVPVKFGSKTIHVKHLAKEQAAWLAKWQKAGGFCYLFLGLTDYYTDELKHYAILRCLHWPIWLEIPNKPILIEQLIIKTIDQKIIHHWFTDLFLPQAKIRQSKSLPSQGKNLIDDL
jgi:hypothetical protein